MQIILFAITLYLLVDTFICMAQIFLTYLKVCSHMLKLLSMSHWLTLLFCLRWVAHKTIVFLPSILLALHFPCLDVCNRLNNRMLLHFPKYMKFVLLFDFEYLPHQSTYFLMLFSLFLLWIWMVGYIGLFCLLVLDSNV